MGGGETSAQSDLCAKRDGTDRRLMSCMERCLAIEPDSRGSFIVDRRSIFYLPILDKAVRRRRGRDPRPPSALAYRLRDHTANRAEERRTKK